MKVAEITVAIATLDRPDSLAQCLDALWSGEVIPAQLVVVDQSRDDQTRRILEHHGSLVSQVKYIRQGSRGLAKAQNLAFEEADFPIVAIIDDDCVADQSWLATIDRSFASINGLDAITGRILPLRAVGEKRFAVASRTSTVRRDFTRRA